MGEITDGIARRGADLRRPVPRPSIPGTMAIGFLHAVGIVGGQDHTATGDVGTCRGRLLPDLMRERVACGRPGYTDILSRLVSNTADRTLGACSQPAVVDGHRQAGLLEAIVADQVQKVGTAWVAAGALLAVLAVMGATSVSAFAPWSAGDPAAAASPPVDTRLHYQIHISKQTRFVAKSRNPQFTWSGSDDEGVCNCYVNDQWVANFPANCNYGKGDKAEVIQAIEPQFFPAREGDYIRFRYIKKDRSDEFDVFTNQAVPGTLQPFEDAHIEVKVGR